MRASYRNYRPVGVLLIAGFYMFGAVVLMLSMVFNGEELGTVIAQRHGLPVDAGDGRVVVLLVVVALALAISYGLYSLSRCGFFLTVAYLCYFGAVNLYLTSTSEDRAYIGNFVWSALVLVYLYLARGSFFRVGSPPGTRRPRA